VDDPHAQAMDYQQALDYLYSYIDPARAGPAPDPAVNLRRTHALLLALGSPHESLRCVVVAGTKGKGSVCAMLESIARAAGLRTGLWTSPHLHSYRERIQVDRCLISEEDLVRLVVAWRPAIEDAARGPDGPPSTFAIGMALALCYFVEQRVDLAVIEVGLGGRYDSANVLTPLLSVITSISYDHILFLGATLGRIAWEKAGILKPGVPGVTIEQHPEAQQVIAQVAAEVGAPLAVVRGQPAMSSEAPAPRQLVIRDAASALAGTFQRDNTRLAHGAAILLREVGLPIDDQAIAHGLASTHWPARFEVVDGAPPVVIDGAHNGDSMRRLVESLRLTFPDRPVVLVFGSSRDKDLARMIPELAALGARWVLTRSGHPRAMVDFAPLREQVLAAQPGAIVLEESRPTDALALALAQSGPDGVVCVTGSLFVAAAAREALGLADARDPER
jgi:dihydrofolate synthase / folylpolyglutamate synthase